MHQDGHAEKAAYLQGLFEKTYITDVIERNQLKASKDVLEDILNFLASSVWAALPILPDRRIHFIQMVILLT
jgi:predicted AAA+ superfamily ATPase